MELKLALTEQFRAGLTMLQECVERCPDSLWSAVIDKPPRTFWRIAYHALFYSHFYLTQQHTAFTPWEKHVPHAVMTFAEEGEPLPPEGTVFTKREILEYIDFLTSRVGSLIDSLDLASSESGFPWYSDFPKLNHVLLTLRHLGVHTGQLQELLCTHGITPGWVSR